MTWINQKWAPYMLIGSLLQGTSHRDISMLKALMSGYLWSNKWRFSFTSDNKLALY